MVYLQRSLLLTWLVPPETAAISARSVYIMSQRSNHLSIPAPWGFYKLIMYYNTMAFYKLIMYYNTMAFYKLIMYYNTMAFYKLIMYYNTMAFYKLIMYYNTMAFYKLIMYYNTMAFYGTCPCTTELCSPLEHVCILGVNNQLFTSYSPL